MTLKMDSRDDRIGRSVSIGELMNLPGVMPPTYANQCGWIRKERWEREEDAIARLIRTEMGDKESEDPEERQVEAIRATMRLKQRNLGIFAEDNMTMDLLTSWLLGDQTWNRAVLENIVVVIDGLEMLDDNRPVNAILRDLRNMLSPTAAILAGCFVAGSRDNDAVFAEAHCNADVLVRMSTDGTDPSSARVFG